MTFDPKLKIGQAITNETLYHVFKCGNMGGMRLSRTNHCLVIISDHTKGLYEDKWYGSILHYTGMGKRGDQTIIKTANRTLAESCENGVAVFLFEVLQQGSYIYRGEVQLCDRPYQEQQRDEDGKLRQVWMFPLQLKWEDQTVEQGQFTQYIKNQEKKAQKLSLEELQKRARQHSCKRAARRQISGEQYIRDPYVAEYARRRAKGVCQLCGQPAPFVKQNGEPYLESHHIEWLSEGGEDTVENTVALCPNCHCKMHVLNLPEDCNQLKKQAMERKD